MIYLDNNATTSLDPRVLNEILPLLSYFPSNPSSIHHYGQRARGVLVEATRKVANLLDVLPQEILFTSGATESLNTMILGVLARRASGHVITSKLEHSAVLQPLEWAATQGHVVSSLEPAAGRGSISVDQVASALRPQTCLIVLMGANNETGVLSDLEQIAALAEERGIPLIVDGVAWMGKVKERLPQGIAAFCISPHKFHGPMGVGIAYARRSLKWEPLIRGGPQQGGKRGGTENVPGIVGAAKALELLYEEKESSISHMRRLREIFENGLKAKIPSLVIHGENEPRNCNTTSAAFPGVDGEALLMRLDLAGLAASHGSACITGAIEPSRVLLNMGISKEIARSSLRFSLSKFTTEEEIHSAVSIITSNF